MEMTPIKTVTLNGKTYPLYNFEYEGKTMLIGTDDLSNAIDDILEHQYCRQIKDQAIAIDNTIDCYMSEHIINGGELAMKEYYEEYCEDDPYGFDEFSETDE